MSYGKPFQGKTVLPFLMQLTLLLPSGYTREAMGKEALETWDFPPGERPPTDDIVGMRTIRAPGVISDKDLDKASKSGPVRSLLDDLAKEGIHGFIALQKRHVVTVFTSRNAKILALTAATLGAGAAAYALTRQQRRKKST